MMNMILMDDMVTIKKISQYRDIFYVVLSFLKRRCFLKTLITL